MTGTLEMRQVIAAAVRVTGVSEAALMGRDKSAVILAARWAMWGAVCETSKHSRANVARRMKRDHSTLYHGLARADREMVNRIKAEAWRAVGDEGGAAERRLAAKC